MPTIPVYIPPVTPADVLNNQPLASESTITVAGANAYIPIQYGPGQLGANVYAVDYDEATGIWTVGVYWCWGEIEAIDDIWINGEAPPVGVLVNHYLGDTSQGVDPLLAAAIPGYSDTLIHTYESASIGIAHSVIQYSDDHYSSFPEFVVEVRGRKIFDPRDVTQQSNDFYSWKYSENPSLALRDFLTERFFGPAVEVDDATVIIAANHNDETVLTEVRRKIGLTIGIKQTWDSWRKTLDTYAGCWSIKRGSTWVLISDRPRAVDFTVTQNEMLGFNIIIGPEPPTHVRLWYTDTTDVVWRERAVDVVMPGVTAGSVPRRTTEVRMPGVLRFSQAKREANERLKKLTRYLQAEMQLPDDYVGIEIGDVIKTTHPFGMANVDMRVIESPSIPKIGRPSIRLQRYSVSDYDDSEATVVYLPNDRFTGKLASIVEANSIGWSIVSDDDGNRPADNADVTADNTAGGITNQGSLATKNTADFDTDVSGASKPDANATLGSKAGLDMLNESGVVVGDNDIQTITEEGTFTPVFYEAASHDIQVGKYIVLGDDIVICLYEVQCGLSAWSAATSTNPIILSGFPFFNSNIRSVSACEIQQYTHGAGMPVYVKMLEAGNSIAFWAPSGTNTATFMTISDALTGYFTAIGTHIYRKA